MSRLSHRTVRPAKFQPEPSFFGRVVTAIPGRTPPDFECHSGPVMRESVAEQLQITNDEGEHPFYLQSHSVGSLPDGEVTAWNVQSFPLRAGQRVQCHRQPNGLWIAHSNFGSDGFYGTEFIHRAPSIRLQFDGFEIFATPAAAEGLTSYAPGLIEVQAGGFHFLESFPRGISFWVVLSGTIEAGQAKLSLAGSGVAAPVDFYFTAAPGFQTFTHPAAVTLNPTGDGLLELTGQTLDGSSLSVTNPGLFLIPLADTSEL